MMIPNELTDCYSDLQPADIYGAIEIAAITVLSRAFDMGVTATYLPDDGLQITGMPHIGDPVEITHDRIGKKLRRHLLYAIEHELQARQTVYEAERLRQLQGKVLTGFPSGLDPDGSVRVEMDLSSQFRRYILLGTCPRRYQPLHERDTYLRGKEYSWYVCSVLPVTNHRQTKVRIVLSRTSKQLPAILLRQRSGIERIICLSRIPGGPADIVTAQKIPKVIINSVGKETGDIYRVRILKTQI
jgi:hypothetical protein